MNNDDFKKIGKILDKKLAASEKSLTSQIDKKIEAFGKRIISEIGDFVNESIIPQFDRLEGKIDGLEDRMDRMESRIDSMDRKLDKTLEKNIEQDQRLDKVESIPVIAHQLKAKA